MLVVSTIQPRTVFTVLHELSPFLSFLRDTDSYSSIGEKTLLTLEHCLFELHNGTLTQAEKMR